MKDGIIASLARPGGNVTGVTLLSTELEGKRIELLKEASRKLSHVAVLVNSANSAWENYPQVVEPAAQALKLRLERAEVGNPPTLKTHSPRCVATESMACWYSAILCFELIRIASRSSRPGSNCRAFQKFRVRGSRRFDPVWTQHSRMGRQAEAYVEKILNGAKPADLPVERPSKFEFLINLRSAKQLSLPLPPAMLARADKVIK